MEDSCYKMDVQKRSFGRFLAGFLVRLKSHIFYSFARCLARRNGAKIGPRSIISLGLARKANSNLRIGNCSAIQTDLLDLRAPINIGDNVIICAGVEILTCSHFIDSSNFEFKPYGIEIDDYAWIASRAFVLPSCKKIGRGAICAAGSLVAKDVEPMSVVAGNPATHLKIRKQIHADLVVESLMGGDFEAYLEARLKKSK